MSSFAAARKSSAASAAERVARAVAAAGSFPRDEAGLRALPGLGDYTAAAVAAMFHIVAHATFKAALFMAAGIVDHEAHTRSIKRLGGLRAWLRKRVFSLGVVLALLGAAAVWGLVAAVAWWSQR